MKVIPKPAQAGKSTRFPRKHAFILGVSCLLSTGLTYGYSPGLSKDLASEARHGHFSDLSASSKILFQDQVKGKVVDNAGQPVVGVTVTVRGTNVSTATDANGAFAIRADKGAILQVFALGYQAQDVVVSSAADINITLKDIAEDLEEVVVVGYGKQNKALVTGAISQISGDVLQNRSTSRITQALQGQMPGLNINTNSAGGAPNAKQSINVRGFTGLGSSGAPLVVIDGVQGGDLNTLNGDDIESISVLKDAASSAIYGSSAPYGVILVTTKQGKKGAKPTISYNNNFSWAQPIGLPKMLNSLDFANLYNEASLNGGGSPIFNQETLDRIKAYQNGTLSTETIKNPAEGANEYYEWEGGNANNDWFDIFFKDFSFNQQHNMSVSGGSDKTTYFVGLGYNDRNGMYKYGDENYKRFNVRTNLTTQVTDWMDFSLRGAFSKELSNSPHTYWDRTNGNFMHQIARKWPNLPLYNPDGNLAEPNDVSLMRDGGRSRSTNDKAVLTGEFNFRLAKGWTATANYTFDATYFDENSHVKTVYSIRPDGSEYPISGTTTNGFSRANSRLEHHIINVFTKSEKQLGDHYFSVLGGYVRDLQNFQSYGASNSLLYANDMPSLGLTYGTSPSIHDGIRRLASDGFFGRVNYNYQQKYLVEFNGRYDGTSRFLADQRWKFYPGVSVGWNVDKEDFFEPIKHVVSNFKLRGSYGSLGDQAFLDEDSPQWYPFHPGLITQSPSSTNWLFDGSQQAAVGMPPLVNRQLAWVTTTTLNLGADLTFLQNRLNASFDWYIRKADDFAGPASALPGILGATPPAMNNAAMETRGKELSLSWRDKINEVSYGLRLNVSDYSGKVTRYPNPAGLISDWYVGQNMGDIWGYETVGIFQSQEQADAAFSQDKISGENWGAGDVQYADLDGDEIISYGTNTLDNPGDRRIIGNNTPRYAFGFTGDVAYKAFDLSFFIQGVAKRDAWIGSNYFWGINGGEWQSSPFDVHNDRWTADNPNGYFPKFYLSGQNDKNQQTQTRYLQNAAYLRLKNLQVGYTVPKTLLERAGFSRARIYLSVDNVFTVTDLISTMDPELSIGDAKIYPLQRTFSMGVNLSF